METKRCPRCGVFHINDSEVCASCYQKDLKELKEMQNFMDTYSLTYEDLAKKETMNNIIASTGVNYEKFNRFMDSYLKEDLN